MPGIRGTMKEYKTGLLRSGSKTGPKVKSRAQAIAIGLSEERAMKGKSKPKASHKKGGNTKIDMGSGGRAASEDASIAGIIPHEDMRSADEAAHKMGKGEMYPPHNLRGVLQPEIEHHMQQAAMHAGKSEHSRTMREHHEGMARALRSQLHAKPSGGFSGGGEYP